MKNWTTLLIAGLGLLAAATASAQTVWRCGTDGRSYSAIPCAEGRAINVSDSRSLEEVRAAEAVHERERRLAQSLAQQRALRESETQAQLGTGMAALGPLAPLAAAPKLMPKSKAKLKLAAKAKPNSSSQQPTPTLRTSRAVARETRHAQG